MGFKREYSPSWGVDDAPSKRLKRNSPDPQRCLHCNSYTHAWNECIWPCLHCTTFHPRQRCLALNIRSYTPGGFAILSPPLAYTAITASVVNNIKHEEAYASDTLQSNSIRFLGAHQRQSVCAPQGVHEQHNHSIHTERAVIHNEGINTERAAMIASTPIEPTNSSTQNDLSFGPQRTGMNTLPLGPRKSRCTTLTNGGAVVKKSSSPAPTSNPDFSFVPALPSNPILYSLREQHTQGINSERAAMIANTPPLPPNPKPTSNTAQRTGINTLPLGPKKPMGTSWPIGAAVSKTPATPTVVPSLSVPRYNLRSGKVGSTDIRGTKVRSASVRNTIHYQNIWQGLKLKIESTVNNAATQSKRIISANDRSRLDLVLNVLKPLITGEDSLSGDLAVSDARLLQALKEMNIR